MPYELRKYENEKYKCPRCGGRTVKIGSTSKKIRRQCQDCDNHFYEEKIASKIRVLTNDRRSTIIEIMKPFDDIMLSDIHEKIPDKRIIGWCK